jgi:hypothetical protein
MRTLLAAVLLLVATPPTARPADRSNPPSPVARSPNPSTFGRSAEDGRLLPWNEANGQWLPAGQGLLIELEPPK